VLAGVASRRRPTSSSAGGRGALEEAYRRRRSSSSGDSNDGDDGGGDDDGGARKLVLLPALWPRLAARFGDRLVALEDPRAVLGGEEEEEEEGDGEGEDGGPRSPRTPQQQQRGLSLTYARLEREVAALAGALARLGLARAERVALFADGSPRWLVADQAVMRLGCADAVRGASAPPEELAFIAAHSRSAGLIFQDAAAFLRAAPALARAMRADGGADVDGPVGGAPPALPPPPLRPPKFVVLLWGGKGSGAQQREEVRAAAAALGVPSRALATYGELVSSGPGAASDQQQQRRALLPPDPDPDPVPVQPGDLATIVYTSGTTGARPKGCPLTHGNLAYQLSALPARIGVEPGDVSLALLPPWHVYARVANYVVLSSGGTERYSSARHLKDDLSAVRPAFLVAVPLLLEALHARATARVASQRPWFRAAVARLLIAASQAFVVSRRRALGLEVSSSSPSSPSSSPSSSAAGPQAAFRRAAAALVAAILAPLHALARLLVWAKVRAGLGVTKAVVSGGASLPPHLDAFFEAAGIELTSGYGLTETSPVLACRGGRRQEAAAGAQPNVRGTVGRPLPGTQLRVVDPETLKALPDGRRGLVLARGPGVFGGYLDDAAATAAAFPELPDDDDDDESAPAGGMAASRRWFSTGDLGFVVPASAGPATAGCLVLSGRAKDTIVLLSGENVEPEPIEGALAVSRLIKHALVVGQDRRELGVLIFPSEEAEEERRRRGASAAAAAEGGDPSAALRPLEEEIEREVARLNAARPGGQAWERVSRVEVAWGAALSPDDGTLTRTFKVRRAAALERHAEAHGRLLAGLRG
jgi:long-chain acyl-CoA synthetase